MAPYLLNVPKDVPSANVVVNNDNDNPTEGGEEEDIVPLLATGEEGEEEEEDETSDEEEEESLAEIEVDTEDEDEPVAAAAGAAAAAVSKGGNGEDEIETVSLGNEDAEGEDLSQPIISKKSSPSSRKSLPLLQDGNTASSSPAAAAGASTPEEAAASSEEVNPLSSKPRLLLRSMRTQGRRILVEPFERLYEIYDPPEPSCDILSIVIHCQMWHLADKILGHLDALSLKTCEEVSQFDYEFICRCPVLVFKECWLLLITIRHYDTGKQESLGQEYVKMAVLKQQLSYENFQFLTETLLE